LQVNLLFKYNWPVTKSLLYFVLTTGDKKFEDKVAREGSNVSQSKQAFFTRSTQRACTAECRHKIINDVNRS